MSDMRSMKSQFLEKVNKIQDRTEAAIGELQAEEFHGEKFHQLYKQHMAAGMAYQAANMMGAPLQKVLDER